MSTEKAVSETAAALRVVLEANHVGVIQVDDLKKAMAKKRVIRITTLMQPSQLGLDICDQRFLCRMAKKLGCHFCARK